MELQQTMDSHIPPTSSLGPCTDLSAAVQGLSFSGKSHPTVTRVNASAHMASAGQTGQQRSLSSYTVEPQRDDRAQPIVDKALQRALMAVAQQRDLSSHLSKLKAHYGDSVITELAPRLEAVVRQQPHLLQTAKEWMLITAHHPHLARLAPLSVLTDPFY